MRRALGFSGFVRVTQTLAAFSLAALALACGENPISPYGGKASLRPDGLIEVHFSYPDSVRYGNGSDWVTYSLPLSSTVVANILVGEASQAGAASVTAAAMDFIAPTSNPTYTVTSVDFAPEATPATNLPIQDFTPVVGVPIGFTFNFFGNAYTTLNVSPEGLVQFGKLTKDGCCWGWFIPRNDEINNVIALGWSAWSVGFVSKPVRYETRGSAPNRRFVLQFNNVPEDGGSGHLSAQLILFEHSNDIVIYTTQLNTSIRRHSITQGIENATGNEAYFMKGRDSALYALSNDGVKFALAHVNTPPVIPPPADINVSTDAGACVAKVNPVAPAFTDDAPGATIAGVRADGGMLNGTYAKGTSSIKWTATDAEGLQSFASQSVIVSDKETPALAAVENVALRTSVGLSSGVVKLLPPAVTADNCGDAVVTGVRSDNALIANPNFPIGVTTVTWTAKDGAGNLATVSQTITVTGNVAPVLVVPADIVVTTDPGACVATVDPGTPIVKDDILGATVKGVRDDGQPLASPFKPITTTITWTATDADRAEVSATQKVTVNDKELPVVAAPQNITVRQERGVPQATVTLSQPAASDNCGNLEVSTVRSDNRPFNAPFAVGVTTVTWTATDGSNNVAKVSQTVTVVGNVPPVVTPAANIVANTDRGVCVAAVNLAAASVRDDIEGWSLAGERSDGQPLNAAYPKGVTTVKWTATDYDYATSSASQTVTVEDHEKPSIVAPRSQSVPNDRGLASAVVAIGSPSVEENCPLVKVDGARSDGASLAAAYPVGVTSIAWTATDASGNSASAVQTIEVRDTESPVVVVPNDITVNATSPSGAVVNYSTLVGASDNVGVVSLVCAPASGSVFGIGYKEINCVARDAAGNSAAREFGVKVLSAHEQILNLVGYIGSLNLSNGVANPLLNQLRAADASGAQSCKKLNDFVHMASVKDGSLSSAQSAFLVSEAKRIESVLGC